MLGEYIREATAKPMVWALHDCSTFCADWRVLNGLPDPMADIRGRYHDELTGLELIERGGGLLQLWSDRMPTPCTNPSAGAVGVLNTGAHIMGLYTGERWIVLLESGIRSLKITDSKILSAWNLNG